MYINGGYRGGERNDALGLLIIFVLLTLSFNFFSLQGFSVSGAALFAVVFLFKGFIRIDYFSVFIVIGSATCLILIFISQSSGAQLDEFTKSFFLTMWFLFVFGLSFKVTAIKMNFFLVKRWVKVAVLLIVGFQFLQVLEQFLLGSYSSWFMLDKYSISTAVTAGRFEAAYLPGYMRPISFYHEPSYLAFVLLLLYAINAEQIKSKSIQIPLVLGIFFTLSSVVLFFFIIYLILNRFKKDKQLLWLFALFPLLVLLLAFFPEAFRLNEIITPGTSGHERIMVPYDLTLKYLESYPFGLALGQSTVVFNNSLFLVILYVGVLFPFLLFVLFWSVFNRVQSLVLTLKYFTLLGCLLFLSGALFTLEGAFFVFLINSLMLVKR